MMAGTIYFLSLLVVSMMPLLCTANCDQGISVRFSLQSYKVVEDNGPTQPVLYLSEAVDCCSTISVWVHVEEIDATHQTNPGEGAISGIHDIVSESYIQVLFPGGLTEATFSIGSVHDVLIERNETFRISIDPLSLPYGVVLGAISNAIVTIVDNDEAVVSFDKTTYTVEEQQGAVDVTLNLDKPVPFADYTVDLEINDGTTTPCDYESTTHTIPIPVNTTSFDYTVVINEDDLYELDETFTLRLTTPSDRKIKIGRPASTKITITDNDNPIHVTLTAQETIDETAGALKVDLTLDKPSPCCLHVYVKAEEESATGEGVDYGEVDDGRQYEVIFPAGTDCSSIEIPIFNDNLSEPDEKFTVRIMEESLPFGIELGDNTAADVLIIDNDIYLMFGSEEYTIYEHEGELCVTVEHDKPALFNTSIEIIRDRGSAIAGEDYVEGPYSVTIPKGERSVELCINIIDDEKLEEDKDFAIEFNTSALHPDVVVMDPQKTKITIMDNEYTFCFEERSYSVREDDGSVNMTLTLSKALPFNISVKFVYTDLTARGNQTTEVDFDYYTAIAFPTFDTILPYTTSYNLSVKIVPNSILENNKLFLIAAQPEHRLLVQPDDCHAQVDVIIVDDDDIKVNFESKSYGVRNKNKAKTPPKIRITYPEEEITSNGMFPIVVEVIVTNITAEEGVDFQKVNYTFEFEKGVTEQELDVFPIDDNVVEADEIYNLTIKFLSFHLRVVIGENKTTTITLYDDDVAYLSLNGKNLESSKKMELPVDTSATVNTTYINGQHNMTTVTREQAKNWMSIPLPIFQVQVAKIDVHFPCKFQPLNLRRKNVQPDDGFEDLIEVHYDCDS